MQPTDFYFKFQCSSHRSKRCQIGQVNFCENVCKRMHNTTQIFPCDGMMQKWSTLAVKKLTRGFKLLKVQYYVHWGWYFYFLLPPKYIIVFLQSMAAPPPLFILCLKAPFCHFKAAPKKPSLPSLTVQLSQVWADNTHHVSTSALPVLL